MFTFTAPMTDHTAFPTDPGSEDAFREQFQRLHGETRDFINNSVVTQQAWIPFAMKSPWVSKGAGFPVPGYYKDTLGIVHFRGVVQGGTIGTSFCVVLPVGYRACAFGLQVRIPTSGYSSGLVPTTVTLDSLGNCVVSQGGVLDVLLDGISYRAEG